MRTLCTLLGAALLFPLPAVSGSLSANHPDVVVCEVKATADVPSGKVFLYLSAIGDDGSSLYQSLGKASLTVQFSSDGEIVGPNTKVCNGASLGMLIENGQTKSF